MKKIFIVYAVIIVLIVVIVIFKFGSGLTLPFGKTATATIKNQQYTLMVARSEHDKTIGLSGKRNLGPNSGMIFVFSKDDYYPFWMKDMNFAIDILFLKDNKIDTIYKNVPPPATGQNVAGLTVYRPQNKINYVLELPAGTANKLGLKKGDTITLRNVPK